MEALPFLMMGSSVVGGIAEKKAANKAAAAAARVGEFNAKLLSVMLIYLKINALSLITMCLSLTSVSVWRFVKRKVRL